MEALSCSKRLSADILGQVILIPIVTIMYIDIVNNFANVSKVGIAFNEEIRQNENQANRQHFYCCAVWEIY